MKYKIDSEEHIRKLFRVNSNLSQIKRDEYFVLCLNRIKLPVKIGLLYNVFVREYNYCLSYRSFKRLIDDYTEREFIIVKKVIGGSMGTTTIIKSSTGNKL